MKNKTFSILGDSISTFTGYLPNNYPSYYDFQNATITGVCGYFDTWWGQVIEHFEGKLMINNSWSGSYVCKAKNCEIDSYGCSDERTSNLGDNPDIIIVFMGTNDRGAYFSLISEDKNDLSVIENAYSKMLEKIKNNYPNTSIWCCTLPKTKCSLKPNFVFPEMQLYTPMREYSNIISKVALKFGCNVIDLFNNDELCDTIDCIHPNKNGMKVISNAIIKALEK